MILLSQNIYMKVSEMISMGVHKDALTNELSRELMSAWRYHYLAEHTITTFKDGMPSHDEQVAFIHQQHHKTLNQYEDVDFSISDDFVRDVVFLAGEFLKSSQRHYLASANISKRTHEQQLLFLAELILSGSEGTQQCFQEYVNGNQLCVLASAYKARVNREQTKVLDLDFNGAVITPVTVLNRIGLSDDLIRFGFDDLGFNDLAHMLTTLNDDDNWERERIADYIRNTVIKSVLDN